MALALVRCNDRPHGTPIHPPSPTTSIVQKYGVHNTVMDRAGAAVRSVLLTQPRYWNYNNEAALLEETKRHLKMLLDVMYGGRKLPWTVSLGDISKVTMAAQLYDCPRTVEMLREQFMSHTALRWRPVEMYVWACRLGWLKEVNVAASMSLEYNIKAPASWELLQSIRPEQRQYLIGLHNSRVACVIYRIRDLYIHFHPEFCPVSRDREQPLTWQHSWFLLDFALATALKECPLGRSIGEPLFWDNADLKSPSHLVCLHSVHALPDRVQCRAAVISALRGFRYPPLTQDTKVIDHIIPEVRYTQWDLNAAIRSRWSQGEKENAKKEEIS